MKAPDTTQETAEEKIAPQLATVRAGSTEALGQVLQLARQYLLGVANGELQAQVQAKAGASDLVQETFLEAQRIFHRFQGQTARELVGWLRGILLNKLAEVHRRYQGTDKRMVDREVSLDQAGDSRVASDPQAATPSPSSVVSLQEQTEAVRQALARLPEHYRQVIVWRQWEELAFEEIGARLHKSADAVRMLWWRAVERLQQELDPGS